MATEEGYVQERKKFTRSLHVVKVVDVSFSKDGDRQYRVCWEETWEQEDDLLSSCKDLLRDYWENHLLAHISQEKETEATINKREVIQPSNYTIVDKVQEFLPSEDHLSPPVLTPLYPFPSSSTFPVTEATEELSTSVNCEQEETHKSSSDLPEQYKNVAFASSVRKKFSEKVPKENNVDYVEYILSSLSQRNKQTDQRENTTKKFREETIQQYLSYKKGIRVTCEICQESFADKKSLLRHKICRHEKFSPHQCPICKKMFLKPGDVRRHVAIHMESRDFRCQHCQKTYKTNNHLQRHVKSKHAEETTVQDATEIEEHEKEGDTQAGTMESQDTSADMEKEGKETDLMIAIHGMNNSNDPILEPVSIGTNSMMIPDSSTLLNSSTAALLNSANAILQNHTNVNDQFFSRPDVQLCLMDRGFF